MSGRAEMFERRLNGARTLAELRIVIAEAKWARLREEIGGEELAVLLRLMFIRTSEINRACWQDV